LLCVDDIDVFSNGSIREAKRFQEIVEDYNIAIGMEINLKIYVIYFDGMELEDEINLLKPFPFKLLNFRDGFKYLGFLLKQIDMVGTIWDGYWK